MTEDRLYTQDGCPCGDAWCHGCDDPQTEADISASYDAYCSRCDAECSGHA